MAIRDLFTPSFRNRLRLFFVVIVIIPMVAVALVLFQLVSRSEQSQVDAQLGEAQRVAQNLYRDSTAEANAAGKAIVDDTGLTTAIAKNDPVAIQGRLDEASRKVRARKVLLDLTGPGKFEFGNEIGVAPARNALQDQQGRPLGRLVTSVDSVASFSRQLESTAEVGVVIVQGGRVLGASRPELARQKLPDTGSVEVGGTKYRVSSTVVDAFDGSKLKM